MKNLVFKVIDHILFVYYDCDSIDDDEWEEVIDTAKSLGDKYGHFTTINYCLGKGTPTATQRKRNVEKLGMDLIKKSKAVILTENKLIRGATTAVSWLVGGGERIKAYKLEELEKSLDWIGLDETHKQQVFKALDACKVELSQAS